jgi:hypothetical protein
VTRPLTVLLRQVRCGTDHRHPGAAALRMSGWRGRVGAGPGATDRRFASL